MIKACVYVETVAHPSSLGGRPAPGRALGSWAWRGVGQPGPSPALGLSRRGGSDATATAGAARSPSRLPGVPEIGGIRRRLCRAGDPAGGCCQRFAPQRKRLLARRGGERGEEGTFGKEEEPGHSLSSRRRFM